MTIRQKTCCPIGHGGAFTLLELMLVLVILSIMIGMAAPSLSSFKKERDLASAAQITASACKYARSLAVTTGRRTRLGIDRENNRIDLLVEQDPLDEPGEFSSKPWPTGLTGNLPGNVIVEQVYYPVVRDEGEEEEEGESSGTTSAAASKEPDFQDEEEAIEEREAVLVFDPDGSTRDTFIYLNIGSASSVLSSSSDTLVANSGFYSVAIIGAIGTTVIVPRYTEEIFEVYDKPAVAKESSESGEAKSGSAPASTGSAGEASAAKESDGGESSGEE